MNIRSVDTVKTPKNAQIVGLRKMTTFNVAILDVVGNQNKFLKMLKILWYTNSRSCYYCLEKKVRIFLAHYLGEMLL